jgi:hypothetical protein
VVVSIDRRQAPLLLIQLPAGAATPTSGPKLLYPTFVPALRRPATAISPLTDALQFAGASTDPLELPADATTNTPMLVTVLSAV